MTITFKNPSVDYHNNDRCVCIGRIVGGERMTSFDQSNRIYSAYALCGTIPSRYDKFKTGFYVAYYEKPKNKERNK